MTMDSPGDEVGWFNATQAMELTTLAVSEDEPCFYLGEFNIPSKSGKRKVRYQLLRVVRGDRLQTAYVYLGLASSFAADPFQVPGGFVDDNGRGKVFHTVGELREIATELRSRPPLRDMAPTDLQTRFREHVEERARRAKRQSTFGNKGSVIRA